MADIDWSDPNSTLERQCTNKDCTDWKKVQDIPISQTPNGCPTCGGEIILKSDIDTTEAERAAINGPAYVKDSMPYGFENEGHT